MSLLTRSALQARGYVEQPDGSFAKPGSAAAPRFTLPKKTPKGTAKPREKSPLAGKFERMWESIGGPTLTPEHRFTPERKWRFDYAHLRTKIAVEVEGITRQGGRHQRFDGYQADCEKYFEATAAGWTVFRLTGNLITEARLRAIHRTILESES